MNSLPTYEVKIFVGLRIGYSKMINNFQTVINICQNYCNEVCLCVTVTPTTFVYVNGNEPGAIIGLINYPRFPSTEEDVCNKAIKLAEILKEELQQQRVSVMTPTESIMIGES